MLEIQGHAPQHLRPRVRGVQFGEGSLLQNSRTPSLRSTGFEDSLSAVAHGLCCQPLEVGLASEARSTTKESAKAEGRDEHEVITILPRKTHPGAIAR